jgi:hypothetical protein
VKDKDLIQALRDILKKNLTSEAGSAILEQMGRSKSNLEDKMVVVSVYNKTEEDSWLPFAKPLHEFSFAPHEYELAVETMQAYDADEFDVSIMFGNISKDAMNGVQMAPYFEFISSQAPIDNVLSGTKSEYVGEA